MSQKDNLKARMDKLYQPINTKSRERNQTDYKTRTSQLAELLDEEKDELSDVEPDHVCTKKNFF